MYLIHRLLKREAAAMQLTQFRTLALATILAVLTAGCQTLHTSNADPQGARFYDYVRGQSGVFHTVSGVTFYELKGERPGKFHTVAGTTYYNFGPGKSGHFQSLDGTSFYNFDEGTSGTFFTHDNGSTEYGFGGPAVKTSRPDEFSRPPVQEADRGEPPAGQPFDFLEGTGGEEHPPEIAESTFHEDR